jgi:hypothetical protein
VSCSKLDACLAQADGKHEKQSAADFKACIQKFCEELYEGVSLNKSDTRTAICDEKGREVWKHISKAVAKVKISFIELRTSQPDTYTAVLQSLAARAKTVHMAEVCKIRRALRHKSISPDAAPAKLVVPPAVEPVPVPAKTKTKLPVPHNKGDEEPATCSKLDACLNKADANDGTKAATEFKACIQDFCEEAYEGVELNKTDDTRTELCDEKGKELWNYIAKAKTGSKTSFVQLRRSNPDMYATVLKSLAALTSVVHVAEVCVLPQDKNKTQQAVLSSAVKEATQEGVLATEEATSKHIIPVPAKPDVKLPDPHGTPDSKHPSKEPKQCSKLDACLAKADAEVESKAAADFQACISTFCQELYTDRDTHLPEPTTKNVLCDNKGKEVWGYIAKQGAKVKTGKAALFQFRTRHPDAYTTVLTSLFAHASEEHMVDACRLDPK